MISEKACGCIIFNEHNKVLVEKGKNGNWGFPKGHVEDGETEEETAIREVKEEVNVDVEIEKGPRYQLDYIIKGKESHKTVVYFIAKYKSGKIKIQFEEVVDAKWVSIRKAKELISFENIRDILDRAAEYKGLNKKRFFSSKEKILHNRKKKKVKEG